MPVRDSDLHPAGQPPSARIQCQPPCRFTASRRLTCALWLAAALAAALPSADLIVAPSGFGFDDRTAIVPLQEYVVHAYFGQQNCYSQLDLIIRQRDDGSLRLTLPARIANADTILVDLRHAPTTAVPYSGTLRIELTHDEIQARLQRQRRRAETALFAVRAILNAEAARPCPAPRPPDLPPAPQDEGDSAAAATATEPPPDPCDLELDLAPTLTIVDPPVPEPVFLALLAPLAAVPGCSLETCPDLTALPAGWQGAANPRDPDLAPIAEPDPAHSPLQATLAELPPLNRPLWSVYLLPMTFAPRVLHTVQLVDEGGRPLPQFTCAVTVFEESQFPGPRQFQRTTDDSGCFDLDLSVTAEWELRLPPAAAAECEALDSTAAPARYFLDVARFTGPWHTGGSTRVTLYSLRPPPGMQAQLQLLDADGLHDPVWSSDANLQHFGRHIQLRDATGALCGGLSGVTADGRFTIPTLPPGHYDFVQTSNQYDLRVSLDSQNAFTIEPDGLLYRPQPLIVRLRLARGHRVKVQVIDAESNQPLPGIRLVPQALRHAVNNLSDRNGRADLSVLPLGENSIMLVNSLGTRQSQILNIDHDGEYRLTYRRPPRLYFQLQPPVNPTATEPSPTMTLKCFRVARRPLKFQQDSVTGCLYVELSPDAMTAYCMDLYCGRQVYQRSGALYLTTDQVFTLVP